MTTRPRAVPLRIGQVWASSLNPRLPHRQITFDRNSVPGQSMRALVNGDDVIGYLDVSLKTEPGCSPPFEAEGVQWSSWVTVAGFRQWLRKHKAYLVQAV